jgi:glycine hydroxymethyltransferase
LILCKEEHAKAIDKAVFPGTQGGPLMHVIAAKAVAFHEALDPSFTDYSKQVVANAQAMANGLMGKGLKLVSDGTDNHLLLADLRPSHPDLSGKDAEHGLEEAGITVNKNTVPGETRSPFVTSGLRIGTAALTTRGMKEAEMKAIADWIMRVLDAPSNDSLIQEVRGEVNELCDSFPLYEEFGSLA